MAAQYRLIGNKSVRALLIATTVALTGMGVAKADTTFTVDPGATWLGYMNVFERPANGGGFVFGSPWGIADLNSSFTPGLLTLSPNTIGDPNPFWYTPSGGPGSTGNKTMEANLYVEKTNELGGQNVTFTGNVLSNTMSLTHPSVAFIKDFAPDYSSFNIATVSLAAGTFNVVLPTDPGAGRHVQYGFQTVGENVWFTDTGSFGTVKISTATPVVAQWALATGGDWDSTASWSDGVIPGAAGASANFLGNLTSPVGTVSLNVAKDFGVMKFSNANSYVISGSGTLNLVSITGMGSISASSGSHQINVPLNITENTAIEVAGGATLKLGGALSASGLTLTKSGPGTLKIAGPVSNTSVSTLSITGGIVELSSNLGANTSVLSGGIRTDVIASQELGSLSVSTLLHIGPSSAVTVSTKALAVTGHIEMLAGRLAVDYTGASELGNVQTLITNGNIGHTAAPAGFVLASGEASDLFPGATGTFGGLTIDSSTAVVAYTVVGDANLDGTVGSDDFNKLVAMHGTTSGARWTQADFTGDGKVNTLDFNILAGNFGVSAGAPTLGSVVPEPASASLILGAAALLFGRTRRGQR